MRKALPLLAVALALSGCATPAPVDLGEIEHHCARGVTHTFWVTCPADRILRT